MDRNQFGKVPASLLMRASFHSLNKDEEWVEFHLGEDLGSIVVANSHDEKNNIVFESIKGHEGVAFFSSKLFKHENAVAHIEGLEGLGGTTTSSALRMEFNGTKASETSKIVSLVFQKTRSEFFASAEIVQNALWGNRCRFHSPC